MCRQVLLPGSGRIGAAVTSRIRCGWLKFKELAVFCIFQGALLEQNIRTVVGKRETRMIRWMSKCKLSERKSNNELRKAMGVDCIAVIMYRGRLL